MDTSKLFADKSELYAAARPHYPDSLFAMMAGLVDEHDAAWDCATGNGQAAQGLAQHFARVEATDISASQIDHAFTADTIRYSVCAAEQTDFADAQFDLVNVAQALHWFDLPRFWPEVKRVLKPKGAFVTSTYSWMTVTPAIDDAIERTIKQVIAPYWADNNRLCWDGYASLTFPFERVERSIIPLVNQWTMTQYFDYLHTWSATRRCMAERGSIFFEAAQVEVAAVWGDVGRVRHINTPLTVIVCQ